MGEHGSPRACVQKPLRNTEAGTVAAQKELRGHRKAPQFRPCGNQGPRLRLACRARRTGLAAGLQLLRGIRTALIPIRSL